MCLFQTAMLESRETIDRSMLTALFLPHIFFVFVLLLFTPILGFQLPVPVALPVLCCIDCCIVELYWLTAAEYVSFAVGGGGGAAAVNRRCGTYVTFTFNRLFLSTPQ